MSSRPDIGESPTTPAAANSGGEYLGHSPLDEATQPEKMASFEYETLYFGQGEPDFEGASALVADVAESQ